MYRYPLETKDHTPKMKHIFSILSFFLLSIKNTAAVSERNSTSSNVIQKRSRGRILPIDVGFILDDQDWLAQMGYRCVQLALSDFYTSHDHYKTRLVLHTSRKNRLDVVNAASSALYLIKDVGVKAMIGPPTSAETEFVINLGTKAQVPIISYSATSPFLSSIGSQYFFRAAQNDIVQVKAIGALLQAFGWKEAIPMYENSECGQGIMLQMVDMLQGMNTHIPYQSVISSQATDDQILEEMYKLKTMSTRVFIVHMWPTLGSRMFLKAQEAGMMSQDYVWILTNGMGNLLESLDHRVLESMQGVIGIKSYVPKTQDLENFTTRWSSMKFKHNQANMVDNHKLNIYGLWAYDAASALARAAEEVGPGADFELLKVNGSSSSTNLDDISVSKTGPKLVQALSKTSFKGLAGDFSLSKGELQSSTHQIVNIVGNGWREIGFWTPENGLIRDLNNTMGGSRGNSTLGADLRAVIWPGDSFSVPKGWAIPTSGKKLRVGVPVRPGFYEFVKVTRHPETSTTEVTGYCIDVFDAAMAKLPYYVPYEYIPFANADGSALGSYDDLAYQVYIGNYDAVAGDMTIIANRSNYVDFTLPYTESGVTMVTPIKEIKTKKAWMFLKPLTWDLWVTTFCSFMFIAFVIWVLEHRVNDDFRGPPLHQAGTTLYYSFSTMVFAQSESVFNNLARLVMVVWIFVVFILTQSYTASLTSMLTVQQLQPTVNDVNELIKRGEYVGYQQGSFVQGLLKHIGFEESKLRFYKDSEELDNLLSKGSKNGGIAAVFDEVPYMTLFIAKFCDKYTMANPTYKAGGFGFVFPKGSQLVSDVSRAILNVTEGEKMTRIEREWITNKDSCDTSNNIVSYDSLGLESFWGLFLIAGLVAVVALIIFIVDFLYKNRKIWMNSNTTIQRKIELMAKTFDERDEKSHKFRKNPQQPENSGHNCERNGIDVAESNTSSPPSLFSYFSDRESQRDSTSSSKQGSPSPRENCGKSLKGTDN